MFQYTKTTKNWFLLVNCSLQCLIEIANFVVIGIKTRKVIKKIENIKNISKILVENIYFLTESSCEKKQKVASLVDKFVNFLRKIIRILFTSLLLGDLVIVFE